MTILIADDEQTIRDYLATAVDWKGKGYELLEAENGRMAVELMEHVKVDLVILDITMPGMTGLEVLEWIRRRQYPCVVSLLTCHDEFEYAREALKAGCFDYILKSDINDEQFSELVERMSLEASEDARQKQHYAALEAMAARSDRMEAQSRINYWLNHTVGENPDMEQFLAEKLGFSSEKYSFALMSIVILDYANVVQRYTNHDNVHFLSVFDNVLDDLLKEYHSFYIQNGEGIFTICLGFEKRKPFYQIMSQLSGIAEGLKNNPLQIRSRIHYSLPFHDILQIHGGYQQMKQLASMVFYPFPDQPFCINDYITDEKRLEELLQEFQAGFQLRLEQRNLIQLEVFYNQMIQKIVEEMYCLKPSRFIHMCNSCVSRFLPEYRSNSGYEREQMFREYLMQALQPFCIPDESQDKKSLVKKAILLIQQNYSSDISLDWLADKLCVNSSYLSRLFSQEAGMPMVQYINQYRIEQAKKMMNTSSLKLYEVAQKAGFSSSIVFSSVFKKITGETPTEYKKRLL